MVFMTRLSQSPKVAQSVKSATSNVTPIRSDLHPKSLHRTAARHAHWTQTARRNLTRHNTGCCQGFLHRLRIAGQRLGRLPKLARRIRVFGFFKHEGQIGESIRTDQHYLYHQA